jgi:hypothetical protein
VKSVEAAKEILREQGTTAEEMEIGEHHQIGVPGLMDLTIEKIGENRVSVAHYYTQHGDIMSDPEIVFKIQDSEWTPIRYTQHPNIHRHDENGLPSVQKFAEQWSRNLKKQGFTDLNQ